MYLSLHDADGKELPLARRYGGDIHWAMSPPQKPTAILTLVNVTSIMFDHCMENNSRVTQIGLSHHPDSDPFLFVPLKTPRTMQRGERLYIGRGMLTWDQTRISAGQNVALPEQQ